MSKTIHNQKKQSVYPFISHIIYSGILGIVCTFLFLFFCAWIFTLTRLPTWATVPLSTTAVSIGTFFSSYILSRKLNKNGLFCGLCFGIFYFILYLGASLLNRQFDYTAFSSIKLVCYILSGCLGGFFGILSNERNSRKKRMR